VRSDTAAKLTLALGCPPSYEEQVYTQAYTATCPRGQQPHWGYLTYNASTPGTSTILFQATTASDPPLFTEPPSTAVVDVAVAHGAVGTYTTDTQVCAYSSTGDCPVPLFPLLGSPAEFDSALQLRVTLRPTATASPQLTDWNISYSCLDSV
jgi:hypothetical protein